MNVLSHRISAKASDKNKSSEFKIPPFKLSEHVDREFAQIIPDFDSFSNALSLNAQLEYVRSIGKGKQPEERDESSNLKFLVVLFLDAPLKHPLKNSCARLLSSQKDNHELIADIICNELRQRTRLQVADNAYADLNNTCNSIGSCFENFTPGIKGIQLCVDDVAIFLKTVLQQFITILSNEDGKISPTGKMEIFSNIHNTFRVLLAVLQKCNFASTSISASLAWIECHDWTGFFLQISDLPMDTKAICCMVLVVVLRLHFGEDAWAQVLRSCFRMEEENKDGCNQDLSSMFKFDNTAQNQSCQINICICAAIINIVDLKCLSSKKINEEMAVNFICSKLLDISKESSVDSTNILGIARAFISVSRSLCQLLDENSALEASNYILNFVWSHLEYYVDSVQHLSEQIFTNIVKLSVILKDKGNSSLRDKIFDVIMSLPNDRLSKSKTLATLGSELGCSALLKEIPSLVDNLLLAINSVSEPTNVSFAFGLLMTKHAKESCLEEFYDIWIKPVLSSLMLCQDGDNSTSMLSIYEDILAKAVKIKPELVAFMIPKVLKSEDDCVLSDGELKSALVCLHVAKKTGLFDSKMEKVRSSNPDLWKNMISFELLDNSLIHQNSEIRVLALALIVDSHKTTEFFTAKEFQLIAKFLEYNINVQSPAVRQRILALTKKLLKRWKDAFDVIIRKIDSSIFANDQNSEVSRKIENEEVFSSMKVEYTSFIQNLWDFCMRNIFPGANYSRRNISLQILVWCQEINRCDIEWCWKEEDVDSLKDYLEDSYECNKQLAVNILAYCPPEHLKFNCNETLQSLLDDAISRASSCKPTECVSSAYKLELLTKYPEYTLNVIRDKYQNTKNIPFETHYLILNLLVNGLQKELIKAQQNILIAAAYGPMYGLLYCIRHILETIDFSMISSSKHWSRFICKLIKMSFAVNEAVSPIVNNSSPEGHLPMDFNAGTTKTEGNGVQLENGVKVSAQMVLLCAWRSVKEVSLLLGEISYHAVIISKYSDVKSQNNLLGYDDSITNGTIDEQQLLEVGDHFTTLLAETKHRGAFEQAYLGFSKLCSRLWKCQSESLHNLPRIWLDDLIAAISSDNSKESKLCATRRSAGVPFMVQALVTTELQVTGNPHNFHKCMATLIDLSTFKRSDCNEVSVETRTHCLNILRALYRHTALGEFVNPYVADGLMTSISGFDGSTWAERNSSTLLFSSLMTRIFGVQRSKDSDVLCIRNRMTGRIFFLRYPKLYDFILMHLKNVETATDGSLLKPSLYPVLLLLARLYPSSLEGTDSSLQLVAYIPYLLTCAGSCVLKTRQLAAKAMVPLISPNRYFDHLLMLVNHLSNVNIQRNLCHGLLLQLLRLLEFVPQQLVIDETQIEVLGKSLEDTLWILSEIFEGTPCFVTAEAYVRFVHLLMKRFPKVFEKHSSLFERLAKFLQFEPSDLISNNKVHFGKESFCVYVLHLQIYLSFTKQKHPEISNILLKNLQSPMYEVILTSLNYLLCFYNVNNIKNLLDVFEIGKPENEISCLLSKKDINRTVFEINTSSEWKDVISDILNPAYYPECQEKALMLLTCIPDTLNKIINLSENFDSNLRLLIDGCDDEGESINFIYLRCIDKYFESLKHSRSSVYDFFSKETVDLFCNVLFNVCSADSPVQGKMTAVALFLNNFEILDWGGSCCKELRFEGILLQWSCILQLLDDDDDVVRNKAALIVTELSKKLSPSDEKSYQKYGVNEVATKKMFFEALTKVISQNSPESVIPLLLMLIFTKYGNNTFKYTVNQECQIFDKGEVNIFQEEIALTDLCFQVIKKTFDKLHCQDEMMQTDNTCRLKTILNELNNNSLLNIWMEKNPECVTVLKAIKKIIEETADMENLSKIFKINCVTDDKINHFKIRSFLHSFSSI